MRNRFYGMSKRGFSLLLLCVVLCSAQAAWAGGHQITFKNYCSQPIWVGQDGTEHDGWKMEAAAKGTPTRHITTVKLGFSGRWWPRTGCTFDSSGTCNPANKNCCKTGGCFSVMNKTWGLKCVNPGQAPVSLFEPTFDAHSGNGPIDYLDLSVLDGFSVPMKMEPDAGTFNANPDPGMSSTRWCKARGWITNPTCPATLKDDTIGACWGPCKYFTTKLNVKESSSETAQKLCCSYNYNCSPYANKNSCDQSKLCNAVGGKGAHGYWGDIVDVKWPHIATESLEFVNTIHTDIPNVYAWQYDDVKSTYFCRRNNGAVNYTITFCPPD